MTLKQQFVIFVVPTPTEAAAWYVNHLGFEVVAPLGWYEHLRHPDGFELGFMAPDQASQPSELHPVAKAEGLALSFEVADLDATWKRLQNAGQVVLPPKREDWGQYHFLMRDAAGLIVDFIETMK